MRKSVYLFAQFFILFSFVFSDFYIRTNIHTDKYYYGGVVNPAEDRVDEMWYDGNRLAVKTTNIKTVLDMTNKKFLVLFYDTKEYFETTLPLNKGKIFSPQILNFLNTVKIRGKVTQTQKTGMKNGYKCSLFRLNTYIIYQSNKVNETDSDIWVTENVPFDHTSLNDFMKILRTFRNYDPELIKDLNNIKGVPVFVMTTFYPKGFGVNSHSKVSKIEEVKSKPENYEIPKGFKKKEKLTFADLRRR